VAVRILFAIVVLGAGAVLAQEAEAIRSADATAQQDAGRDRAKVYRFDPVTETLESVSPVEIRPGHVYSRYESALGVWVWSKADRSGQLRYSMGEGSVQPARMFDLRGTDAERQRALEQRAPELARLLTIQGARPMLRLNADGRWEIGPTPCVSSVYDMATRERWEWHHDVPCRIAHTAGTRWEIVDGRYVPSR
jgi:hypothetical protein